MISNYRLIRNSVFFKFGSISNVEKIDFEGTEIAIGDLKAQISEAKALPKQDLILVNASNGEEYARDSKTLQRNMTVIVKRRPPQKKGTVIEFDVPDGRSWGLDGPGHKLRKRKLAERPVESVSKKACPPEYLCSLCGGLFDEPNITQCCGRSACKTHFMSDIVGELVAKCPLCKEDWHEFTQTFPNKSLAESVARLNLDYYTVPGLIPSRCRVEVVDDDIVDIIDLDDEPSVPSNPVPKEEPELQPKVEEAPASLGAGPHHAPVFPPSHGAAPLPSGAWGMVAPGPYGSWPPGSRPLAPPDWQHSMLGEAEYSYSYSDSDSEERRAERKKRKLKRKQKKDKRKLKKDGLLQKEQKRPVAAVDPYAATEPMPKEKKRRGKL